MNTQDFIDSLETNKEFKGQIVNENPETIIIAVTGRNNYRIPFPLANVYDCDGKILIPKKIDPLKLSEETVTIKKYIYAGKTVLHVRLLNRIQEKDGKDGKNGVDGNGGKNKEPER